MSTDDFCADLYSLGVCALEAVSGRPALRGRRTGSVDVPALAQGVSPELQHVLKDLVHGSRRARVQTGGELLSRLRALRP
jgi:hypothetical protein